MEYVKYKNKRWIPKWRWQFIKDGQVLAKVLAKIGSYYN